MISLCIFEMVYLSISKFTLGLCWIRACRAINFACSIDRYANLLNHSELAFANYAMHNIKSVKTHPLD